MTSKNSFLTNLGENIKRRLWVLAVFCLYFFFAYPVASAVLIHSYMYDGALSEGNLQRLLTEFHSLTGANSSAPIFILILALLAGVQGFAWLHNQVKVDMYHSLPVARKRRFGIIYLNGILIFALPYLAGLLFSGIIFLLMTGRMDFSTITTMLAGFLMNMLYYLCMYHLAIVCVMLTGNVVVTLLAYLVLNSYEAILRALSILLYSSFFDTYYETYYEEGLSFAGLFSPVPTYVAALSEQTSASSSGRCLILLAGFLLISGALAFFLYLKRPSEASGKSIAFTPLKAVLKFFITIPFALLTATFFFSLADGSVAFTVFGLLVGLLLCHAIMEVIFEFDIRAAFRRKKQILICGVPALCIYLIFVTDLFHYDSYVPSPDSVESAAVVFTEDFIPAYINQDGDAYYGYYYEYALNNMRLTDIGAVTALAANSAVPNVSEDYNTRAYYIVKYYLKDGREIYRRSTVDYAQHADLIEAVYSSPEYHMGMSQLYDGEFTAKNPLTASYYNGVEEYELDEEQTEELLKIYLEDYKTRTFRQALNDHPVGCITFSVSMDADSYYRGYYIRNISYPVYDSFQATASWLEAKGVSVTYPLNADTVELVRVENSNRKAYDEMLEQGGDTALSIDTYFVSKDYDDPKQLEQILSAVYPTGDLIAEASPHFTRGYNNHSDVDVTIKLRTRQTSGSLSKNNIRYSFRPDAIPSFVLEDTTYQAK